MTSNTIRRRIVGAAVALTAVGWPAMTAAPSSASEPAQRCATSGLVVTCTYGYTGHPQYFQVPDRVDTVRIAATGGAGGDGASSGGNAGGRGGAGTVVKAVLPVTAGQSLNLYVGARGTAGTADLKAGGWNGGGGSFLGGTGGDASDVRTGTALNTRIIVAAGGGGGAEGTVGTGDTVAGAGGTGDADGSPGTERNSGGKAGTATAGGEPGSPDVASPYSPVSTGQLGVGGVATYRSGAGGGGLYGGGGGSDPSYLEAGDGSVLETAGTSGGGGGGSSLAPADGSTVTPADRSDPPSIVISYVLPGTVTVQLTDLASPGQLCATVEDTSNSVTAQPCAAPGSAGYPDPRQSFTLTFGVDGVLLAHQGRNPYDIAKCLTSDGAEGAPASVTYCTDSLPQLWHPGLDVWSGLLQLTDYQGRELDGTRSEPLTTSATVQVWVPSPLH